jgi:hypothetical protein
MILNFYPSRPYLHYYQHRCAGLLPGNSDESGNISKVGKRNTTSVLILKSTRYKFFSKSILLIMNALWKINYTWIKLSTAAIFTGRANPKSNSPDFCFYLFTSVKKRMRLTLNLVLTARNITHTRTHIERKITVKNNSGIRTTVSECKKTEQTALNTGIISKGENHYGKGFFMGYQVFSVKKIRKSLLRLQAVKNEPEHFYSANRMWMQIQKLQVFTYNGNRMTTSYNTA